MSNEMYVFIIDYKSSESMTCGVPYITAAIWHPRQATKLILGLTFGGAVLYDYVANQRNMEYPEIHEVYKEGEDSSKNFTRKVLDICFSPGEDVFLVHQANGKVRLFGQEEPQIRMEFEQQAGMSRVHWLDNISGDFITASGKVGALKIYNAA